MPLGGMHWLLLDRHLQLRLHLCLLHLRLRLLLVLYAVKNLGKKLLQMLCEIRLRFVGYNHKFLGCRILLLFHHNKHLPLLSISPDSAASVLLVRLLRNQIKLSLLDQPIGSSSPSASSSFCSIVLLLGTGIN